MDIYFQNPIWTLSCQNLLLYLDVAQLKNENSEQFIFRAITVTKKNPAGTLRSTGSSLSYTRMRDVLLEELESIGLKIMTLGYIVWNPEAPQPQLTVVCQIDCLNDMDDGNLKRQRMDISKMIWMLYYRYQHLSVYNNLSIFRYTLFLSLSRSSKSYTFRCSGLF